MRNEVNVVSLNRRFGKLERGIRDAARFFLETLDKKNILVDIYLVSERKMRQINKTYKGRDSSTNVLSFPSPKNFPNGKGESEEMGEIYLSPRYISRNGEDINYMLLHGILHLLGFNHKNKSDRIRMEKVEDKLIKWLNSRS